MEGRRLFSDISVRDFRRIVDRVRKQFPKTPRPPAKAMTFDDLPTETRQSLRTALNLGANFAEMIAKHPEVTHRVVRELMAKKPSSHNQFCGDPDAEVLGPERLIEKWKPSGRVNETEHGLRERDRRQDLIDRTNDILDGIKRSTTIPEPKPEAVRIVSAHKNLPTTSERYRERQFHAGRATQRDRVRSIDDFEDR